MDSYHSLQRLLSHLNKKTAEYLTSRSTTVTVELV